MTDNKKTKFIYDQQQALLAVANGLEALATLKVEYTALGYGTITPEDLENSTLEDFAPADFVEAWNAFDALYTEFLVYKTIIYKVLP